MSDIVSQDVELVRIAERIRERMKRTAQDIIDIGRDLIAAKERIGHGGFGDWLEAEFQMSDWSARQFMNAYERFGSKLEIISDLSPTVLYLLAAPSTPESVVEKVTYGEVEATVAAVKAEVAKAKAEAEAERKKTAQLQMALDDARTSATNQTEEYRAAQEREKALRRTIEALQKEVGQAKETIVEKPDPKQARKIAELEGKLAKAEKDRQEAERKAKELAQQIQADEPDRRIRDEANANLDRAANHLRNAIGLMPSPRVAHAFGVTEWRGLETIEQIANSLIEHVKAVRSAGIVIDAQ